MVLVCDKRYHIYNRFRHFWTEIKKLWNYPLLSTCQELDGQQLQGVFTLIILTNTVINKCSIKIST